MSDIVEKIQSIKRCHDRAQRLRSSLFLCSSAEELCEVLHELGFNLYEYKCSEVYCDGKNMNGIVNKMITRYTRSSIELEFTDIIDLELGAIMVRDTPQSYVFATLPLDPETLRQLHRTVASYITE